MNRQLRVKSDRANRCLRRRPASLLAVWILVLGAPLLAQRGVYASDEAESPPKAGKKAAKKAEKDPYQWKRMFDGKTLKGWKVPNFGGEGEVYVKDGAIVMEMGSMITGITWTGKELPETNYELQLEARRTLGGDFFATTTFPVGKESCSFVVGGWAGTVVGLSCVDWYDASDNVTSDFMAFEDNRWYKIRIRVTDQKIDCWIDDDQMVDLTREGHKFSVRIEVDLCRPLGVCAYETEGHVRNLRIRRLKPEEIAAKPDKK